ncbi:short-chain dehydrogenase/reductase [Streptomyces sp. DH7]|uniref:short-chain dehydrogenase/reductase n=1 Tax=Streptomyces sp. DH7 TaxID=2857006 RepID=UPI0027E1037C|nr:short-chain dehydrogenase/reductase [Streptomyces sp. DH7]
MAGRAAVAAGAARGLGKAIAKELAARGVKVAALGLEEDALSEVASELPTASRWWGVDITDDVAMARVAEEMSRSMGPVSIVIANAGVAESGPLLGSDEGGRRRVIEINLIGSAVIARSFTPQLTRARGHYLQIASLASVGAVPMMSAYCASKAGVEAFAHSLRGERAPRPVGVNIAYLNWIDTDMIRDADRYAVMRTIRSSMPRPSRTTRSPDHMVHRVVASVERRAPSVYVPGWLWDSQIVRAGFPVVITRLSRRKLTHSRYSATELLGAGGRAAHSAGFGGRRAIGRPGRRSFPAGANGFSGRMSARHPPDGPVRADQVSDGMCRRWTLPPRSAARASFAPGGRRERRPPG